MHPEQRVQIEKIYNKFWKELYIVAFRRLRKEEDVEDILQDVFLSLLKGDINLDKEESIRAYLHLRLKSRIINYYRKQLIHLAFDEFSASEDAVAADDSESRLMTRELENVVKEEINKMPDKMREIFLLSRNDFKTTEEIAFQLNLSSQTVRNQISMALKRVRSAIDKYVQPELSPLMVNAAIVLGVVLLNKH